MKTLLLLFALIVSLNQPKVQHITEYTLRIDPTLPTYIKFRYDYNMNYEIIIETFCASDFDDFSYSCEAILISKGQIIFLDGLKMELFDYSSKNRFHAYLDSFSVHFDYPGSYFHNKVLSRIKKVTLDSLISLRYKQQPFIFPKDTIRSTKLQNSYHGAFTNILFRNGEYLIVGNMFEDSLAAILSKGSYTSNFNFIQLIEDISCNQMDFVILGDTLFCINASLSYPGAYFIPPEK